MRRPAKSPVSITASSARQSAATAWALTWRGLVAVGVGGGYAMLLVALVLVATGILPRPTATGSGGLALGLAMVPALALLLATVIGLTAGVSGVALVVRNHLDARARRASGGAASGGAASGRRQDLQLARSLRTALRSAPRVVLAWAAGAVVLAVLVAASPVAVVVAAAVALWRAVREKAPWQHAVRSLVWAVPFAPAAAAAAAIPAVYASVLNGASLREAVRAAWRSSLRARGVAFAGLVVVIAAGGLLAQAALAGKIVGGTTFDAAIVVSVLIAGAALGALAHTGTDTTDTGSQGSGVAPRRGAPVRRPGRFAVRRARLARIAGVTAVSLVVPVLSLGAVVVPATAARAATDVVVDTAADTSTTVDPDQCRTAGVPCGLRAAVAYAGEQAAADGFAVTVTFAADTTIQLAGTLRVPSGVDIDGGNNAVTIDAQHGFRAIEAYSTGGEGPQLTMRHVRVTGGRSTPGGAGLYSGDVGVTLTETTWDDNVSGGAGGGSGSSPDGGAVALPANTLWVEDSTFVDDHATAGGGGAVAANRVFISNATITRSTGASGRAEGGAVLSTSGGQVAHATVTAGGGIAGTSSMPLEVVNSLASTVSGSLACAQITPADDPAGSPSVGNVDPDGTCLGVAADPVPLGALADNGGPTQTMALEAGNPAIAAGSTDYCAAADQRGTGRDAQQCDAGAFQLSQPAPPPSTVVTVSGDRYIWLGGTVGLYVAATQGTTGQAGSVVLLEGGTQVAGPFTVNPLLDKTAMEFPAPAQQGPHHLVARFTPDDGGPAVDSAPYTLSVATYSQAVLSTEEPAALHQPVTVVATITDRPDYGAIGIAQPGTPVRTGTATLTVNGVDHQVALVNGTATVSVADLQSPTVSVVYSGDDYYYPTDNLSASGWSADITTVDTATTTTADIGSAEYGQPLRVNATVSDASGPAGGSVTLYVDGAAKDTQTLTSGQATLTTNPTAGDHELYVEYTPATGWSLSQSAPVTVHVAPGRTSVAIASAAPSVVYPVQPGVTFDATGTGAADLQLKDADTVVATAHVTLPATGQFTLPAGTLSAGPHHLHAEVVPSATAAAASSDLLDVTLTTGAATVTATPAAGATVGSATTVHLSSDVAARTTYTVTRDSDSAVVEVIHSADGAASFDYTPLVSDVALTVTATFDDGNYATAVAHVAITATKAAAPVPTTTWHNPGPDYDAAPPYLTVTVPTTAGLAAPTGEVRLMGPRASGGLSDVIGYGALVDGTVRIDYIGAPGVCYCGARTPRLQYAGDDTYLGFDVAAPEVDVPAIATTTTLTGVPTTIRPGFQLLLQAQVRGTSPGFPSGRIDFLVNGQVVTSRDLVSGSIGADWTVPWNLGDHAEVTARYVPDSTTWMPSSGSQSATVLYPQPPSVTLEAPDQLKVGEWGHVLLHVEQFDQFIDQGSPITVTDGAGNVLATTYWWGSPTAGTAEPLDITVLPVRGGASQLSAHYQYSGGTGAVSAPLATTVAGATTRLSVTADAAPVAGYPFNVKVTLTSLPPGVQPGLVPVQLYADGAPFGYTQYARSTGTEPPSATFYGVVPKSGFVSFTASTPGDGADLGPGDGGTTVLLAGAPLHLSATDGQRYDATFGKPLTITPRFWWGATTGSGPSDGRLTVAVVGTDGSSRTCEAQLPSLTCTFPAYAVPAPGTYSVRVSYSGGSFYADAPDGGPGDGSGGTDVGDLVVTGTRSTLSTTFDRNPLTWVVGQQVTATFAVADPLDDKLLGTGTVSLRAEETVLCSLWINHARSAACTFTVPDPHQPLAQQRPGDLVGTFTPDGASLPGSSWAQLGTLPHCFTVTSTYGTMPGARHVPAVSGRTCDTAGPQPGRPGTMPGYLEGSAVDLTLVDAITAGWQYTGSQATFADGTTKQLLAAGKTVTVWNLDQDVTVTPQYVWAPTCVTVVTGFESSLTTRGMTLAQWRVYHPGQTDPANGLSLGTPSNCDQPSGMSAREEADFTKGIGHYVIGTPITGGRSHPGPDPAPQKVTWALVDVPGGTAPTARDGAWHATASGPTVGDVQLVFGRFRWSDQMCRTVQLEPGDGGTVSVTGSRFPTAWSEFDDPSGACTTPSGQHGYFAGTDVDVTAKPWNQTTGTRVKDKPNYYLYRWLTADDLKGTGTDPYAAAFQPRWALVAKARTEVPGTTGGITGDPYAAHSTTRTLPFDTTSIVVGAEFGVLSCVPVMVNLNGFPASTHVNMTASTCPGITPANDGSQGAHRATATSYYAYRTHVEVSTDAPGTQNGKSMSWTGRYDGGEWSWENRSSASIDVPYALDGVTLDAGYFDSLCFKRQDGLEHVDADGYGSQVREDSRCLPGWTRGGATQWALMPAAAKANHVKAQWSVFGGLDRVQSPEFYVKNLNPRTREAGYPVVVEDNVVSYTDLDRSYTAGGETVPRYYQTRVDLRFCRDLSDVVTTKLVDPNGRPIPWNDGEFGSAPAAKDLMKTYSGCYGLATEPGMKDAVLLTPEAQKKWTLLAWRNTTTGRMQVNTPQSGGLAFFSSTKDGVVSTSWEAIVTPRCYTLDYSERVNVNTAPNCAGVDPNLRMYNPGTVVHVSWDSGHDDTWGGWDGASGSQDDGTVVMDQDRTVRATWTHDDNFKTNVLEPLSNAAQRVVGAVVTGFNSWLLEPAAAVLSVVQKVATVCNVVASGLEMLGVHGALIDGLKSVSASIGTSIDMLNALGSCTVQWATGDAAAMTPTTTEGKAARAAAGAIAQKVSNSVGNDWMKDAQVGVDLVTLFSGNLDSFSQDPTEAWSSITGIGSCLQQKAEAAAGSFSP